MNSNTSSNTPQDAAAAASSLTVGAGRLLCRCSRCDYWITLNRAAYEPFVHITGMRCSSCGQPMMVIDLVRDPQ